MKLRIVTQCLLRALGFLMLTTVPGKILLGASFTPVTSCTVDGSPVPCDGGSSNTAGILFTYTGLGSPVVNFSASAFAGTGLSGNTSATADFDLTFYVTTEGPVRPGLADIKVGVDGEGSLGGFAGGSGHASVADLISCTWAGLCFESGQFPLLLGVPLQIKLQASALANALEEPVVGFGITSAILLSLYEFAEDGSLVPVNIVGPVAIPEPNLFAAVLFAVLTGIVWNVRARRKARLQ